MKTLNQVLTLGLLFSVIFFSCKKPKKITTPPISWYSEDPVSIPFRTRLQKFERGNLINNNSFESGKTFIVDTADATFRIDGWQKAGNNVEWVNVEQDSIYNPDEAIDSIHSIKIHREKADETDNEGEGIISDFIKVIPGNYSLSYFIKLKNICPNKGRLGTKLYDAINIKLYYYDKNKIPISSELYLPHKDINIDNSFKGFSFSNFWKIDEFGWEKVIGKSHNYACPEGNIPNETRYVKIFFGVKGSGTVWIDNIDFHYTKSNFTAFERMQILTDTIYSKHEVIIPAPKVIEKYESIIYYKPGDSFKNIPIILVPEKLTVETKNAAQLIKLKLEQLFNNLLDSSIQKPKIKIVTRISYRDLQSSKLIFCLGRNVLYRRFKEILPLNKIENKPQSYFIYTNSDIPNLVFLSGNKAIGNYYAATTAVQLFDNKKFIFHNAKVIDYPDFRNRYYHISTYGEISDISKDIKYSEILAGYKLNGAYISNELSVDSSFYKQFMENIGSVYTNNDIFNFKILVAPTEFFNYINGESGSLSEREMAKRNKYNFSKLKSICETGFNAGASGIAYVPYFCVPSEISLCQNSIICNYLNNSKNISRQILNLDIFIKNVYSGKKLEILLPIYNNEYVDYGNGRAEVFLNDMVSRFNNNLSYFWSGNSYHSLNNDNADLERMTSYLNKALIFWDNSIITRSETGNYSGYYPSYPGKIRLYNLFEPYDDENIKVILNRTNTNQIFFNGRVRSELDLIKFTTVADFSWNSRTYDPDMSLWKVLVSRYGSEAAMVLMILNDQYFSLVEVILKMKVEDQSHKLVKKGETIISDLNISMDKLKSLLKESHPLTKELNRKIDRNIKEFNEFISLMSVDSEELSDLENQ